MSQSRHRGDAGHELDVLLSRMPTPGGEPTSIDWEARLERTLQRIRDLKPIDADAARVLATPLPIEAGNPKLGSPDCFAVGPDPRCDGLRAALPSREHASSFPSSQAAVPSATAARLAERVASRRTHLLYWISVAAGTLAAGAALALFVRNQDEPALTAGSSPSAHATQTASALVTAPPQTQQEVVQATALEHEAVKTTAVLTPRVATRTAPPQRRETSVEAATPSASASPSEPPLIPAAGPSNVIDHPSTGAVSAALSRQLPEAQLCLSPNLPATGVRLTFQSNGSVRQVEILNSAASSETRSCLQRALGAVRVEPFARARFDINITISPQSK